MGLTRVETHGLCEVASLVAVPARFAGTPEQLVASLRASGGFANLVPGVDYQGGCRRASLSVIADAVGSLSEKYYLLFRGTGLDGQTYLEVLEMASVTWTIGALAVPANTFSNSLSLKEATQAAVISTNLIESRTGGKVIEVRTNGIAKVEVNDLGEVAGLLRVSTRGAGDGSYPLWMAWD